jgi:hypothetical protein
MGTGPILILLLRQHDDEFVGVRTRQFIIVA